LSEAAALKLRWVQYLLALMAPPGLIGIEVLLGLIEPGGAPALTIPLIMPVAFSASFGGLGPGLTATAAAALGALLTFWPRYDVSLNWMSNAIALIGLVGTGVFVSLLSEKLRRARYQAEASAQRFHFLARAGAVLPSSLEYTATLQNIANLAVEGRASICFFHLVAEDGRPYLASHALADPQPAPRLAASGRFLTSERPGVTHHAIRTMRSGSSLLVPEIDDAWIAANATSEEHARFMRDFGFSSLLTVPVRNGQLFGSLTMVLTAPSKRRYHESDRELAEELGRRAGLAIDNARRHSYEAAYRRMLEMTRDGVLVLDGSQFVIFANAHMVELLGYADASEIVGHPLVDFLSPAQATAAPERLSRRQQGTSDQAELHFLRRDGSDLWTLSTASPLIGFGDAGTGAKSLKIVTNITERKRAEAELAENANRFRALAEERHHAAYHDALTGLPNRTLFMDRLGQALVRMKRNPATLATVFFVDVDHFKVINDSLGHAAGDLLLGSFAQRLTQGLRQNDTVARLGGDEFVILVDDVSSADDATLTAERIHHAIAPPFSLEGREVSLTASIGIALGKPGDDAEALMREADMAMYRAKELGRSRHIFFAPELHARAMERLELEIKLRGSLERCELRLAYQPIFAIESGRVTGFEALARWEDGGQLVSPSTFIPLAEETGLIHALGEWALGEACRQARIWRDLRPHGPFLSVSVNVSAKQLCADRLGGQVTRVLSESGLRARELRLEITESVLMDPGQTVDVALGHLRSLGVAVDLDDFGTGYSSLSYLQRLPIDTLKIDRSFVSGAGGEDLSNPEIVAAIIALALSLGLTVTAEGVETAAQLSRLQALRCTNAQGHYLSHPVDEAGARALAIA
jgi:diguanylate cyclase (GGDEF)-like protein/PAS domain S-box-containing protein